MNKQTSLFICIGLFLISAVMFLNFESDTQRQPDEQFLTGAVDRNEKTDSPLEMESVSVDNSETQKYILRYVKSDNTVILITKKADGTEFSSPVKSINPYYLTPGDINMLTEGMEFSSREDLFMLIEDLSS